MDAMTVRFVEHQYYDINEDCDIVRFMAITGQGTYTDEIIFESAGQVREQRQVFRDKVIGLMQHDVRPLDLWEQEDGRVQ